MVSGTRTFANSGCRQSSAEGNIPESACNPPGSHTCPRCGSSFRSRRPARVPDNHRRKRRSHRPGRPDIAPDHTFDPRDCRPHMMRKAMRKIHSGTRRKDHMRRCSRRPRRTSRPAGRGRPEDSSPGRLLAGGTSPEIRRGSARPNHLEGRSCRSTFPRASVPGCSNRTHHGRTPAIHCPDRPPKRRKPLRSDKPCMLECS
jgi:hypothetical protein